MGWEKLRESKRQEKKKRKRKNETGGKKKKKGPKNSISRGPKKGLGQIALDKIRTNERGREHNQQRWGRREGERKGRLDAHTMQCNAVQCKIIEQCGEKNESTNKIGRAHV